MNIERGLVMKLVGGLLLALGVLLAAGAGAQKVWERSSLSQLERKIASLQTAEEALSALSVSRSERRDAETPFVPPRHTPVKASNPDGTQRVPGWVVRFYNDASDKEDSADPGAPTSRPTSCDVTSVVQESEPTLRETRSALNSPMDVTQCTLIEVRESWRDERSSAVAESGIDDGGLDAESQDTSSPKQDPSGRDSSVMSAPPIQVDTGQQRWTFTPVDYATLSPLGSLPPAMRILIPALDVDVPVIPLELVRVNGESRYRRPEQREVGTLLSAGSPGEAARGWYLGHNLIYRRPAFHRLPEVLDLLAEGKAVDIIVETERAAYLYRVIKRPLLLTAEEFHDRYFHANLYAPEPEIVLVTCVPPPTWSHRLLVTAHLIGTTLRS